MLEEQGAIVDDYTRLLECDYARSSLILLIDGVVLHCTIFYILNRKRD